MNPKKILSSPLINKAALARKMWPEAKDAKVRLANKMNGKNGRSLSEKDNELIIKAISELCSSEEKQPEVRCNHCGWKGDLSELEQRTNQQFNSDYDVCPECYRASDLQNLND